MEHENALSPQGFLDQIGIEAARGNRILATAMAGSLTALHLQAQTILQPFSATAMAPDAVLYRGRATASGRNLLIAAAFLGFTFLMARYKGLPNVLVVMFALIALFVFVTTRTTFGRRIYAMGGNEKAAKLSGINTEKLTFLTFAIMGILAALAGLIFAARLNVATPKAGAGFELDVIAACFIGGAATTGGVGKIIGAVIGAFIMGVMNNGMSIMGIGIDLQQVIKGVVLLLAVFLDVYYKNKA